MKKTHIWIMVLAILFSMATIVEAKETYGYRTYHWEAFAEWQSIYIHVTKSDDGIWPVSTDVYVAQSVPNNYWNGYYSTTDNVFNIDNQLDMATLSPVYINMYNITGAFVKTIEIQAQWTGIDKIQYTKYNGVKSYIRNATATGSEDNVDIGQTSSAKLERYEGIYK